MSDTRLKTGEMRVIPVGELKPARYNPRKALKPGDKEYERIKNSITEFGFADPLVVNKDMTIVGGHQRLTVAMALGYTEVPCMVVDVDKTREKALNIALNKITGAWDEGKLADLLQDIKDMDFNVEFTGFDAAEVDALFSKVHDKEVKEDDFDVESELKQPAFSKEGDLWLLGKHRVYCGDSTKAESYAALMDGQKANLVLTDPLYNVNVEETAGKILNDNMADGDFYNFLLTAYTQMHEHLADDGSIYVWHADTEGLNFRKAFRDAGFYLSGCCIWKKNSLVLGRSPYQWIHEPCQRPGTMVWTPDGRVPIEELKDGDRVVSFNVNTGMVTGYRDGVPIKTASRPYKGKLYGIKVGEKETWTTNNHQFSVKLAEEAAEKFCTYLMTNEKGWWRVGRTRVYTGRGFGLKDRMKHEGGVAAWLIEVFDTDAEAQLGEQWLATRYGIPYTWWQIRSRSNQEERAAKGWRTEEQVAEFYERFDLGEMNDNALRLLDDYDRSINYPFVSRETMGIPVSTRVTVKVNACNILPGLMKVPVPYEHWDGNKTFDYQVIDAVRTEHYDGVVYSLQVEKFEHYIADGIVTHNCLYGWKAKGKHQWYSDRKQTTVWEYDRPKSSPDHPTMKPVQLMAYPIKNSTMTNGIVLDPFLGSGSTLIACCETDRVCRGIELDPKFVDVICKRYIEWSGGRYDDVFVIRDGQKLKFEEVAQFEPQEGEEDE